MNSILLLRCSHSLVYITMTITITTMFPCVFGTFVSNDWTWTTHNKKQGFRMAMPTSIGGEAPTNATSHRDLNRLSTEALYFLHNSGFALLPKEEADVVDDLVSTKVRNKRRFRQRKAEAQGSNEDEITNQLIRKWWTTMSGRQLNDDQEVDAPTTNISSQL